MHIFGNFDPKFDFSWVSHYHQRVPGIILHSYKWFSKKINSPKNFLGALKYRFLKILLKFAYFDHFDPKNDFSWKSHYHQRVSGIILHWCRWFLTKINSAKKIFWGSKIPIFKNFAKICIFWPFWPEKTIFPGKATITRLFLA